MGTAICMPRAEAVVWVWDGELTTGKSGVERNIPDDKDSTGKAGVENPELSFPLPVDRHFEDFDPESDEDNHPTRRHVSPYAAVMFARKWQFGSETFEKGIYHVKLGAFNGGSLKVHQVWVPQPSDYPLDTLDKRRKAKLPLATPPVLTLVISQQGRVKAVIPVVAIATLSKAERKLPWDAGWIDYPPPAESGPARLTIRGKRYKFTGLLTTL